MCTGLTLRHAPPRRPASYGACSALIITPSWPAATARSRKAVASSTSAVTSDGRRAAAGTIVASTSRRTASGSSTIGDPAGVHDVEEVGRQPDAPPCRRIGAEVAHHVLEAPRGTLVVDAEHLAVEHEVAAWQLGHHLGDAAEPLRDVVEVAGVQTDVAVASVGLDAGAVQLPLDGRRAGRGERLGDVGGRRGQHRLDRPTRRHGDRRQRRLAAGQRRLGSAAEVAGHHRRPAHAGHRDGGGLGDGVDHHAVERALAHLAAEHAPQEVLLRLGGATEDVDQQPLPGGGDAGPRTSPPAGRSPRWMSPTVSDGSVAGSCRASRSVAQPTPMRPCTGLPGQEADGRGDLGWRQTAQHGGEETGLLTALARRRQLLRHRGKFGEQHGSSVLQACRRSAPRVPYLLGHAPRPATVPHLADVGCARRRRGDRP